MKRRRGYYWTRVISKAFREENNRQKRKNEEENDKPTEKNKTYFANSE